LLWRTHFYAEFGPAGTAHGQRWNTLKSTKLLACSYTVHTLEVLVGDITARIAASGTVATGNG
jgi:hypothetical protein